MMMNSVLGIVVVASGKWEMIVIVVQMHKVYNHILGSERDSQVVVAVVVADIAEWIGYGGGGGGSHIRYPSTSNHYLLRYPNLHLLHPLRPNQMSSYSHSDSVDERW